MNVKRIRTIGLVAVAAIVLAACGNLKNSSFGSTSSSTTTTGTKTTTTTGTADSEFYQGVIKNGRYRTSKSRGVVVSQNDNVMNLKSFESGLLDVSKRSFQRVSMSFKKGSI